MADATDSLVSGGLESVEAQLRAALNNTPMVLSAMDRDGKFTLSEGMGLGLIGLEPGQVVGVDAFQMYADYPEVTRNLRRALAGETVSFESSFGDLHFLGVYVPYRDGDGNVVGMTGLGFDISDRVRAEREVEAALREKEALLQEVHHRVRNNLQVVLSLLNLQRSEGSEATRGLDSVTHRIQAMALVHQLLYESGDFASVASARYFERLCELLCTGYGASAEAVTVELVGDEIALSLDQAVPCGLIVTELVTNALEHAFPAGHDGARVAVVWRLDPETEHIELTVTDNGIGMQPQAAGTRRTGLRLVDALVEQLGGTLHRADGPGTRVRVAFPRGTVARGEA